MISPAASSAAGVYALLTDGTTVEIRPARPGDLDAVRRMYAAEAGIEVLIGVVTEPVFGPLVVLGAGSGVTDLLDEPATRLTPLTRTDAEEMISTVRAARVLLNQRGRPAARPGGLTDMLLRVSRLADDLPEIARLDLPGVAHRCVTAGCHRLAAERGAQRPSIAGPRRPRCHRPGPGDLDLRRNRR